MNGRNEPKIPKGALTLDTESSFSSLSPPLIQALVFEKPNYDGECLEVNGDVYNLQEEPEEEKTGKLDKNKKTLSTVGSIKILGGL